MEKQRLLDTDHTLSQCEEEVLRPQQGQEVKGHLHRVHQDVEVGVRHWKWNNHRQHHSTAARHVHLPPYHSHRQHPSTHGTFILHPTTAALHQRGLGFSLNGKIIPILSQTVWWRLTQNWKWKDQRIFSCYHYFVSTKFLIPSHLPGWSAPLGKQHSVYSLMYNRHQTHQGVNQATH